MNDVSIPSPLLRFTQDFVLFPLLIHLDNEVPTLSSKAKASIVPSIPVPPELSI